MCTLASVVCLCTYSRDARATSNVTIPSPCALRNFVARLGCGKVEKGVTVQTTLAGLKALPNDCKVRVVFGDSVGLQDLHEIRAVRAIANGLVVFLELDSYALL